MKFLGLLAVCATVLSALASPAAARPDFRCDGSFKGKTYDEVIVPRGATCTLVDARVTGDVRVQRDAYLQVTGTKVRGDIEGNASQTIFVDSGSRISGSVEAVKARQFFVYNSTVGEDIEPEKTRETVQICGNTVRKGNIEVRRSGPDVSLSQHPGTDILIGDPLADGCRGNVVKRGDVIVTRNFADIEFVIRGNSIKRGDLSVTKNTGPVPKIVNANTGGDRLVCRVNTAVAGTANNGWDRKSGQCA
jgi:carbonic anhydrase/acetyltransferase-like protein (isoleucine patch superfamily)